jgi:hypothetical protein
MTVPHPVHHADRVGEMVPQAGIEPAPLSGTDFESVASTNFTTGAASASLPEETKGVKAELSKKPTLRNYTQYGLGEMYLMTSGWWPTPHSQRPFIERLADVQMHLKLPFGWKALFRYDTRGFWYHQVMDECPTCNVTGQTMDAWYGRKWLISEHMTDGEIVQTVFLAVQVAMEHETRELFKYKGQAILDPHYDIEKLVVLRSRPDALKEREQPEASKVQLAS